MKNDHNMKVSNNSEMYVHYYVIIFLKKCKDEGHIFTKIKNTDRWKKINFFHLIHFRKC